MTKDLSSSRPTTFGKIFNSVTSILGTSTYVCGLPVPIYTVYEYSGLKSFIEDVSGAYELNRKFSTEMSSLKSKYNYLLFQEQKVVLRGQQDVNQIIESIKQSVSGLNDQIANEVLWDEIANLDTKIENTEYRIKELQTTKDGYAYKDQYQNLSPTQLAQCNSQADRKINELTKQKQTFQEQRTKLEPKLTQSNNLEKQRQIQYPQDLKVAIDQFNQQIIASQNAKDHYEEINHKVTADLRIAELKSKKQQHIKEYCATMEKNLQDLQNDLGSLRTNENQHYEETALKVIRKKLTDLHSQTAFSEFNNIINIINFLNTRSELQTQSEQFNELLGEIRLLQDNSPIAYRIANTDISWKIENYFSENNKPAESIWNYNNIASLPIKFDQSYKFASFNNNNSWLLKDQKTYYNSLQLLSIYPISSSDSSNFPEDHIVLKGKTNDQCRFIGIKSSTIADQTNQYLPKDTGLSNFPTICISSILASENNNKFTNFGEFLTKNDLTCYNSARDEVEATSLSDFNQWNSAEIIGNLAQSA